MLACARTGAPHAVAGSAASSPTRCQPRRLVDCTGEASSPGSAVPPRVRPRRRPPAVDEARARTAEQVPRPREVLVVRRTGQDVDLG